MMTARTVVSVLAKSLNDGLYIHDDIGVEPDDDDEDSGEYDQDEEDNAELPSRRAAVAQACAALRNRRQFKVFVCYLLCSFEIIDRHLKINVRYVRT